MICKTRHGIKSEHKASIKYDCAMVTPKHKLKSEQLQGFARGHHRTTRLDAATSGIGREVRLRDDGSHDANNFPRIHTTD
jgi:hypothetical protein